MEFQYIPTIIIIFLMEFQPFLATIATFINIIIRSCLKDTYGASSFSLKRVNLTSNDHDTEKQSHAGRSLAFVWFSV